MLSDDVIRRMPKAEVHLHLEGTTSPETLWAMSERHGVALEASRAEIRLYPNGLGLGAANTKLVFRRGEAADSITISRLGRIRRWP